MDLKQLGQDVVKMLLEHSEKTIALFPGIFKPPHKGHFNVVKKLSQQADNVVILISPNMRDGITADESVAVWKLYLSQSHLNNVEIKVVDGSPVKESYDVIKNNPDIKFILVVGKGEAERFKYISKNPNVEVLNDGNSEGINTIKLRAAIHVKNEEEIEKYLPEGIAVVDFLNALGEESGIKPSNGVEPKGPQVDRVLNNSSINAMVPGDLNESVDYNSPYHDYIISQMDKIEKTSEQFNLPMEDVQYAFETGHEVILTDTIWSELQNTESKNIKSLEDVIECAYARKINLQPYIKAIKAQQDLPLPLVLSHGDGKYFLIGGEIELCLYKALKLQPVVLMGIINLKQTNNQTDTRIYEKDNIMLGDDTNTKLKDKQTYTIKEFIKYAAKALGLHTLPSKLILSYNNKEAKHKHTFGYFDPISNVIWLYVKDRNMADILRTLAHEFVHRKQDELGKIQKNSGNTGSEIENEANAVAGILLRNFGKNHEEIYEGLEKNLSEKIYGDYLFGGKDSGVKIGWYEDEVEKDAPDEQKLFDFLKKYANSEFNTYSTISLDSFLPLFRKLKKEYSSTADPELKPDDYIYRGTVISDEKAKEICKNSKAQHTKDNIILSNQVYSSKRQISSWSTSYFNGASFAMTTAKVKGNGVPAVMRTQAKNAELFFNPRFMNKLSDQLEDEVLNSKNPIEVDIMLIKNYKDEFEDI